MTFFKIKMCVFYQHRKNNKVIQLSLAIVNSVFVHLTTLGVAFLIIRRRISVRETIGVGFIK